MSTSSGGPTDLDQLREDYGDRWRIDVDNAGMIHATQRGPLASLPSSRWAWEVDALRGKLDDFEVGQAAFRTGDLP